MHNSPMDIFSQNVRIAITAKKTTITHLADEIGMHRQELSKILNGRVDPTTGTLNRIAEGLSTNLYELFKPFEDAAIGRKPTKVA